MKIIASAAIALFAATLSTGVAQAEPAVTVNCNSGVQDLTNAQVTETSRYITPGTVSGGPTEPDVPPIPTKSYNYPELFVRAFEQLPAGFTAEQYVAQMQESCTSYYPARASSPTGYVDVERPFTSSYVVVVLDTHGIADVAVSPALGITRLMEPHIADFKKAAAAGKYKAAVDSISQATRDEFNALNVAQAKLEPPRTIPCDQQESHEIPAPVEKSFWTSLKDGVTSGDPVAIAGSFLAFLGCLVVGGSILALWDKLSRRRAGNEDGVRVDDERVVDAEVVRHEER